MKLNVECLIIGAGYAGLFIHKLYPGQSFIVDMGDDVKFADSDYIHVMRNNKLPFINKKPITMVTHMYSSGVEEFDIEYSRKLYKETTIVNARYEHGTTHTEDIYSINNRDLINGARIYGNFAISAIDTEKHIASGFVAHIGKEVQIEYDKLVSTIPIYEFAKLVDIDLLSDYRMFIQFYPIGVIKKFSPHRTERLKMSYYSDPLVPFYRKHHYGNTIFYEYCINRKFDIKFSKVIGPGKFTSVNAERRFKFYEAFRKQSIFFAGRYATWDPDFLIDDICPSCSSDKISVNSLLEVYKR